MESQTAYKLLFADYPDVVNVEQMCEMLGGICDKTAYRLLKSGKTRALLLVAAIESRSSTFWNTWT